MSLSRSTTTRLPVEGKGGDGGNIESHRTEGAASSPMRRRQERRRTKLCDTTATFDRRSKSPRQMETREFQIANALAAGHDRFVTLRANPLRQEGAESLAQLLERQPFGIAGIGLTSSGGDDGFEAVFACDGQAASRARWRAGVDHGQRLCHQGSDCCGLLLPKGREGQLPRGPARRRPVVSCLPMAHKVEVQSGPSAAASGAQSRWTNGVKPSAFQNDSAPRSRASTGHLDAPYRLVRLRPAGEGCEQFATHPLRRQPGST